MGEETQTLSGVHVWLVLMKAHAALNEHAHRSITGTGLCDSDFLVLEVLLHKGALPVNAIGQRVRLTSGSISVAVDRLAERGLVERLSSREDRRVRLVRLTDAGHKLIQGAFRSHADAMEEAVGGIDAGERAELLKLLKKLGKFAAAATR